MPSVVRLFGPAVGFAAIACGACGDTVTTESVLTPGVVLLVDIVAEDEQEALVSVELKVGTRYSNSYAALDPGDEVVVSVDGEETVLEESAVGVFDGVLTLPEAAEPEVSVELRRARNDDALDNVGTLPAPFEILTEFPVEPGLSREMDAIELEWEPADSRDDMLLEASQGSCFALERSQIDGDPGRARVAAGALESVDRDNPGTCQGILRVVRTRLGRVDEGLDRDSVFRLRQSRSVTFTSTP